MQRSFFIIFIIVIINGCISVSTPRDNAPFSYINNLQQLEGIYKNKSAESRSFLSYIIWEDLSFQQHNAINTIEVRKITEDTLEVKALGYDGNILKKGQFVNGKDFKFKEGKLVVKNRWRAAESVMVGPNYRWVALGIDSQGQGKSRSIEGGAGLVYLYFPVVYGGYDDVRFEKIK